MRAAIETMLFDSNHLPGMEQTGYANIWLEP